ncbi:MAG: phosphatidylserine decarboxylase [Verrucomicrobia subdivision 3 bacterium]|nr:phosphatidylserine decarboxylase [Limisphaerales bacterium]
MKHSGKATKAAFKLIFWTLVLLLAILAAGVIASLLSAVIAAITIALISVWIFFALFTLYFFRDPNPNAPSIPNAIVSPAHGKVDVIDEVAETQVMGGPCKRISIFLSVIDVHVQNAPMSGTVSYLKHTPGKFLSATRAHCVDCNENVLMGFDVTDYPNQKVAVRLVAGLIARRIITWVQAGETVPRSERISLIQYGSRCDLYLPLSVKIHAKLGDKVRGGETIVASFE